MIDKKRTALYGFCIGDAMGAPVEFMSESWIKKRYGIVKTYKSGFLTIPYFLRLAGSGTDDTRFTFALLKGLVKDKGNPIVSVSKEFNKLRLYPLFIGKNLLMDFLFYFGNWHKTSKFVDFLLKGKTAGNGALMRSIAVPLVYNDLEKIIEITKIQATMTHWSDISTKCCIIYNTIAYHLLNGQDLDSSISNATKETEFENFKINDVEPNGFSPNTLKHVIYLLKNTNSFEELVAKAVNQGGDTDTIAALAGGLGGIYYGLESIPKGWIERLKAKKKIEKIILIL